MVNKAWIRNYSPSCLNSFNDQLLYRFQNNNDHKQSRTFLKNAAQTEKPKFYDAFVKTQRESSPRNRDGLYDVYDGEV